MMTETQFFNPLKIGAYKIKTVICFARSAFFNPLKIGAYKILLVLGFQCHMFFNPLKIGAYKIFGRHTRKNRWFFNPLKIGAYKISIRHRIDFWRKSSDFSRKKLKIISIKRAFQPVFFNFSDKLFLIS